MIPRAGTLTSVNDEIREKVRARLEEEGLSRNKLADELDVSHQYISALLRGEKGGIPATWQRIFERLGLRLIVVPVDAKVKVDSETE